ncbi:osmoprotectant transport system ATP-binding protein [Pullulanibacillus pueri]|uniref:Quaternary amine transport ATP-binding protein n=1 Tax=Pullulanibacillus pueri TaxID=1437324 RepID=A0A8J2ZXJ2_9BACL|nr:betaine/proline/choline family ABC transporter ATP-binding protein [Pullulanibacillus pueri]MBM7683856.1 osmoprotectant transport system ATP-binding protein [Pullulanibacillus pueri]GGH84575.1 glycine betaine/carnitine/choline transport ATP-binding protein OpuCA [Pullulanibacillus pueri]
MLTFDHVSKVYDEGHKAVDDMSLEVKKGEFVVFIGPSGCGKTTTMKMINRLIEPTEGTILYEGEDIMKKNPVELRRSIGYVIQQIALFPHMTIRENIALVPKLLKWPSTKRRARAEELLELVDMDASYLDRYPHELSGGQQQRIGVLRALAANQPLILMDEPFGALDPITRDSLQEEFKKLQQRLQKTIVFVTHDMDEAIKLADKIVIMRAGQIVQVGEPEEILRHPANDFVEEFIGKDRLIQSRPTVKTVDQIMSKTPATILKENTLVEAIQVMRDKRVDSLLVVDQNNHLEGFIDVETIDEHRKRVKTVGDVMTKELYTVSSGDLLRDTVHKFLRRGIKYVPVVNDQRHLIGIVTRASLADLVYDSIWGEEEPTPL